MFTLKRPLHPNKPTPSTTHNSTNMCRIEAALRYLELLKPGEQFTYTNVAEEFGVERSTLAQRHQGISTSRATRLQNQQQLHPQQEIQLPIYRRPFQERLISYKEYDSKFCLKHSQKKIAWKKLG